jgi:hypothetical protein
VRSIGLTGVQRRIPETSKQRTRVGIARLASRLIKFAVAGHPSDGAMTKISDFWLPPYNRRGERMAAICWNPSSFGFLFSLPIFPNISIGLA